MKQPARYAVCLAAAIALHAGVLFAAQHVLKSAARVSVVRDETLLVDLVATPPPPEPVVVQEPAPQPVAILPDPAPAPPQEIRPPPPPEPPESVNKPKPAAAVPRPLPPPRPRPPVGEPRPAVPETAVARTATPAVAASASRPARPVEVSRRPSSVPRVVERFSARSNAAYFENPPPRYPEAARRAGIEGLTLLRVHVDAAGFTTAVEVKHSSGSDLLDRAALEAVRNWRFQAARIGGITVADMVEVPVRFSLRP